MSSVPCARERAELVRAWWVTASGSGVAICGDTGKKLDRPVPAGFETVPQGIRVNLRVRDASGITTNTSNRTRCPPCIPHPSHISRVLPVEGLVLFPPHFMGRWIAARRPRRRGRRVSGVMLMPSSTAPALTRRPLRPLLRQGYGGPTSPHGGEEREWRFPPDSFRGQACSASTVPSARTPAFSSSPSRRPVRKRPNMR